MITRRGVLFDESNRSTEFESGSWLIRCGGTSHREELRRHLPGDLVLRQLRRTRPKRLLLCDPGVVVDRSSLEQLVETVTSSGLAHPLDTPVDAVWDADRLHELPLEERLELISWVDRSLRVGGFWISVARDHFGRDPAWGYPISPEELVGYFSPAYQVFHQEQLSLGAGLHKMTFSALVFTKRCDIRRPQLDLELQRSIEEVAALRRAHHGVTVGQP